MKTRSITEGAMLGAITVLLSIVGEYLGIPAIIVPVPLMLLVYRHGFQLGILSSVAAALVSSLVAGHVFSGLSIIIWGFVGVAVGMGLQEKFSFPKLLAVGALANGVVIGLNVLLYSLIFGGNLFSEMLTMLMTSVEQAMATWQSLGMNEEALTRYQSILTLGPYLFRWGLPALLLIYAVVMSYINLAVLRSILKRMGDSIPWIAPFKRWRIPSYYALFLILGMVLTTLSQTTELHPVLQFLGLNSFIIFLQTYLILGVAIVWHYFDQKKVAKLLRVLFIFLIFSFELLVPILILLAVADGAFDFRKLNKPNIQGANTLLELESEDKMNDDKTNED